MHKLAIIGSGPAGYYTAEAALKAFGQDVRVDVIDRLPVPYGLIRFGVAPDHQSIKAVSKRYEKTALTDQVRFVGNVTVGEHITIEELTGLYDAVILATGAPSDRRLDIPGNDLAGVYGSAAFVGWYNGHPNYAGLDPDLSGGNVAVIGNGNVALDCARILSKTDDEFAGSDIVAHARDVLKAGHTKSVTIIGRRGPHQIAMTPKELGELGRLEVAALLVDPADLPPADTDAALEPGQRKSVELLRQFAAEPQAKDRRIVFDFFASPVRFVGENGRVSAVEVERTALNADGKARGTGETYEIPTACVICCIGYRTPPIPGVPYDEDLGRFDNADGRIADGLYCVGWARRGPTGTIGTNRPDGFAIIDMVAADIRKGAGKPGRDGLDTLLAQRKVDHVTFRDWQKIEAAEIERAMAGTPREKFVAIADMLKAGS